MFFSTPPTCRLNASHYAEHQLLWSARWTSGNFKTFYTAEKRTRKTVPSKFRTFSGEKCENRSRGMLL
jgi:hypothetical protein